MAEAMNKEMQAKLIKDMLEREGISSDIIDVEHEIDSTLTYPENEANIKAKYVPMKDEQMYASSPDAATMQEIQDLKRRSVSRDELERVIDMKLKKLMAIKEQVQRTVVSPDQQATKSQALSTLNNEIIKQSQAKSLLSRIKQLRGVGYRKIIKPYMEKQDIQRAARIQMQKELKESMEKGRRMGYYYQGVSLGREQAKGASPQLARQQAQRAIIQQIQKEILKRKIKQQIIQQMQQQQMQPQQYSQQPYPQQMSPQYYPPQQRPYYSQPQPRFNPMAPSPFLSEFTPRQIPMRRMLPRRMIRRKRR